MEKFLKLVGIVWLAIVFTLAFQTTSQACQVDLGNDVYAVGNSSGVNALCVPGPLYYFNRSTNAWSPMLDLNGQAIQARELKGRITPYGGFIAVIEDTSGALIMRYGSANGSFYDDSASSRGFVAKMNNQHVYVEAIDEILVQGRRVSIGVFLTDDSHCILDSDANGVFHWQWACTPRQQGGNGNLSVDQLPLKKSHLKTGEPKGLPHIPALAHPQAHKTFIQFFQQIREAVRRRDVPYLEANIGFNFRWERDIAGVHNPNDPPVSIFRSVMRDWQWEAFDEIIKSPSGSAHPENAMEVCTPSVLAEDSWQFHHLCFQQLDAGQWHITAFVGAGD